MSEVHISTPQINTCDRPRPAFVMPGGQIYRAAAQGGIRRLTPLDLALMPSAAPVACWRNEANRQED
jgi:hypothetical protein